MNVSTYNVSRWFVYFYLNFVEVMISDLEGSPTALLNPPAIGQVVSDQR